YEPYSGFSGWDSFSYRAFDGYAYSGNTVVWLRVNAPPVAGDDTFTTSHGSPVSVAAPGVLGSDADADGDSLTAVVLASLAHGTVNLLENGQFTYTPDSDYLGSDSFTYRAFDGQAYSAPATVSINVLPIDD